MKTLKTALLVALVSSLALCFAIACGDDDEDDDSGNATADDDDDNNDADVDDDTDDDVVDDDTDDDVVDDDEVWIDSTSGLMWENASSYYYDYYQAEHYCQILIWGGYSDWRMPTISELRSLLRGCEATEPGGECGVTDDCLDLSCKGQFICGGCDYEEGPGLDGCYWRAELMGRCQTHWSSSIVPDSVEYSGDAWSIDFQRGGINTIPRVNNPGVAVRCVR
jgi:Protein of unknown function (DUF1566)